jgi:hypothetical protein
VTVGGGIGMLMGLHGLMIDALQSVKLLTAAGNTVTASREENGDLFWAVRGAGQNFGIVTEATYEVYDQTNNGNVIEANFMYTASQNRSLWELLQTYNNALPQELALQSAMLYNSTTSVSSLAITLWYIGTVEEAQPYLDVFAALGPVTSTIDTLTQIDVYYQSVTRGVCNTGGNLTAYTMGLKGTDPDTLEAHYADFVAFSEANPLYFGQSYIQWYSNEVASKAPTGDTVFPWRDVQAWWSVTTLSIHTYRFLVSHLLRLVAFVYPCPGFAADRRQTSIPSC